jgi:hypothetical protein
VRCHAWSGVCRNCNVSRRSQRIRSKGPASEICVEYPKYGVYRRLYGMTRVSRAPEKPNVQWQKCKASGRQRKSKNWRDQASSAVVPDVDNSRRLGAKPNTETWSRRFFSRRGANSPGFVFSQLVRVPRCNRFSEPTNPGTTCIRGATREAGADARRILQPLSSKARLQRVVCKQTNRVGNEQLPWPGRLGRDAISEPGKFARVAVCGWPACR